MQKSAEPHVILFDGVCNLHDASVNFVLDHDHQDLFRFCALQGDAAYSLVVNRRYSWVGARQSCRVPDDRTMATFL